MSSIRRDHDELQKKIGKLQKQRDECVSDKKMSEVCSSISVIISAEVFVSIYSLLSLFCGRLLRKSRMPLLCLELKNNQLQRKDLVVVYNSMLYYTVGHVNIK